MQPRKGGRRPKKDPSIREILIEGLTKKQYDFALEYMKTWNATQSALKAYPDITYGTAQQIGFDNVTNPNIVSFIANRMAKNGITNEWILQEYMKDTQSKDKNVRMNALNMLAKINAMVSERHININEQAKEAEKITYDSYSENHETLPKA